MNSYKYVYGPVPSRRLGRSLGVDLVPFKTCTYGCVYCQLGRTTDKTLERKAYVPAGAILSELACKLREPDRPDYITLAGSGEPTLNSSIGEIIRGIKGVTDVPVAVLTNGSLLWLDDTQDAASSHAGDADILALLNRRPCTVEGIASGLAFRPNDVLKKVLLLRQRGAVKAVCRDNVLYYEVNRNGEES